MKIDLQVEVKLHDGKYPSFDVMLSSAPGKDPFITIKGCRVINGQKGEFVSYPSRKQDDGKYWNHVYATYDFNQMVLEKVKQAEKPKAKVADPLAGMDDDIPF